MGYLRAHFDEDDLNINDEDVELSLNSDEEHGSSDSDDKFDAKPSRKQKMKVESDVKKVPGVPPVFPPRQTDVETLARKMEDL